MWSRVWDTITWIICTHTPGKWGIFGHITDGETGSKSSNSRSYLVLVCPGSKGPARVSLGSFFGLITGLDIEALMFRTSMMCTYQFGHWEGWREEIPTFSGPFSPVLGLGPVLWPHLLVVWAKESPWLTWGVNSLGVSLSQGGVDSFLGNSGNLHRCLQDTKVWKQNGETEGIVIGGRWKSGIQTLSLSPIKQSSFRPFSHAHGLCGEPEPLNSGWQKGIRAVPRPAVWWGWGV